MAAQVSSGAGQMHCGQRRCRSLSRHIQARSESGHVRCSQARSGAIRYCQVRSGQIRPVAGPYGEGPQVPYFTTGPYGEGPQVPCFTTGPYGEGLQVPFYHGTLWGGAASTVFYYGTLWGGAANTVFYHRDVMGGCKTHHKIAILAMKMQRNTRKNPGVHPTRCKNTQ